MININKNKYETYLNIKLPILIVDSEATGVVPYQVSSPNFIGSKIISGNTIFLNNRHKLKKISLNQKIVLIENADPGFDWIFNFNLKGLVTKFGGTNSHMAIRCNELKVPAAIGVGEKIFEDLKNSEQLILNCLTKKIESLVK